MGTEVFIRLDRIGPNARTLKPFQARFGHIL